MVVQVDSTIGGTSPDYATITLWEAATDNDLVSADEQHNGLCRPGTYAENVVIAGATTDATRFRRLTIDTSAGGAAPAFANGAGDAANVIINPSGTGHCINVQENCRVENIELTGTSGASDEGVRIGAAGITVWLRNLLIHGHTTSQSDGIYAPAAADGVSVHVENCVIYDCARFGIHVQLISPAATQSWSIVNTTIYNPGGDGVGGIGVRADAGGHTLAIAVYNCLIESMKQSTPGSGVSNGSGTQVDFDVDDTIFGNDPSSIAELVGSAASYVESNVTDSADFTTSTASSAVIFDSLTSLHLTDHANNLAIDYGANLTGTLTDDAEGDSRPGSGAWDAGADQVSTGAAEHEATSSMSIPMPTMETSAASVTRTGVASASIPLVEIESAGIVTRTGSASMSIPTPTMDAGTYVLRTGEALVTLPLAEMVGAGVAGMVGESVLTLPVPVISGSTGVTTRTGEGVLMLPLPEVETSETSVERTGVASASSPLVALVGVGVWSTPHTVREFHVDIDLQGNDIVNVAHALIGTDTSSGEGNALEVRGALELRNVDTAATQKVAYLYATHHTQASYSPFRFLAATAASSSNILDIGGGAGSATAATQVRFWAHSNNTSDSTGTAQALYTTGGWKFQSGVSSAPHASSQVEIASTTKGVLFPRMTEAQRDAISSPAEGLVVYNLDTHLLNFYNGSTWGAV